MIAAKSTADENVEKTYVLDNKRYVFTLDSGFVRTIKYKIPIDNIGYYSGYIGNLYISYYK